MFAVEVYLHICEEEQWHVLQNPLEPPLIISSAHYRSLLVKVKPYKPDWLILPELIPVSVV